jgi:hypothetical protein
MDATGDATRTKQSPLATFLSKAFLGYTPQPLFGGLQIKLKLKSLTSIPPKLLKQSSIAGVAYFPHQMRLTM